MSLAVKKTSLILAVLIFALAPCAIAQVSAGETNLRLNATASAGYSDDWSNNAGSDHSIVGAGQADLSGFYYNPNFLSFDIQPFYDESKLNSTFQSLTSASGVSASAKIFGGSHFPGSISYATTYNGSGNYNVPGLANYTTHGNNDTLALNWGVHLKDLPSLNLNFTDANSTYSVYGADTLGTLHADTFSASSAYRLAGFNLNGGYQYNGTKAVTPQFLTGGSSLPTNTGANSFFLGVGHTLPWNGSFSAGASRLDIRTNYGDTASPDNDNLSIDTLTSALDFAPVTHLNVGASAYYTDNLEGTLYNTLLTAGATVPQSETQGSSRDLNLIGNVNYVLPAQHVDLHAFIERQQETFLGSSFTSDSINGQAAYSNTLLGGQFNGVLGLTRTSLNTAQQSLLGLNTSVNYTHQIQHWSVGGGFSYSQQTQTLLIGYTTSGYNYFSSVGRRIRRRSYWGAYASGERSLLTGVPGSANSSQSYSTSLSLSRLSLSGSYSKSSGNALLTSTGLVTTPIPVTVVPSTAVVLYNGNSYSLGLGSNPIHGLTLSAVYAKALSATNSNGTLSNNNNDTMYYLMMYHFRKLDFQAGYSRLLQGFSVSGTPPSLEGSLFVGVSRWFNFF
jgi:hypothetical protein